MKTKKSSSKKESRRQFSDSVYNTKAHDADYNNIFSQTAYEANKEVDNFKPKINKTQNNFNSIGGIGLGGRLHMKDSPTRKRLLKEGNTSLNKSTEKTNCNLLRSEAKVRIQTITNSLKSNNEETPDFSHTRHKNNIRIGTAIRNKRKKPVNIKKAKPRVTNHWSPKRKK